MNTRTLHLVLSLLAALAGISACGSTGTKACAQRGKEGCVCGEGEFCDPGLECRSGVCWATGAVGTGGTGMTRGDGGLTAGMSSGGSGAAPTGATGGGAAGGSGGADGCVVGDARCNGECVDTTVDPRHCGGCVQPCQLGQVCTGGECRTIVDCNTEACTGFSWCNPETSLCEPGCGSDAQCAPGQTCDPATHACGCPLGTHDCGGVCVGDTDPAACGPGCTACAAPADATATCDGFACGFTCNPGYVACGSGCVPEGGVYCGPSCTMCPAPPANAQAVCNGDVCGVACSPGYADCGGQCVPVAGGCVTDGDCCAGQTCFGGECTATPYAPCASDLDCPGTSQCDVSLTGHCNIDCGTYACASPPSPIASTLCYPGTVSRCVLLCPDGICPNGAVCNQIGYCTYL